MKEIIEKIPLTTIIVTYLFICGGFYLIGYWGTFDIDAFSLIEIWDIPKNFIAPFMYSGGISIVIVSAGMLFTNKFEHFVKEQEYVTVTLNTLVLRAVVFLSLSITTYILSGYFKYSLNFWIVSLLVLVTLVLLELMRIHFFIKIIPNRYVRLYFFIMLIFTPTSSFLLGKKRAIIAHENQSELIRITTNTTTNIYNNIPDTIGLKLLGFLGDKFIVSSINNDKIFILNQSAFDVIGLDVYIKK